MLNNRIKENLAGFLASLLGMAVCLVLSFYLLTNLYPEILSKKIININQLKKQTDFFLVYDNNNKCLGSLNKLLDTAEQNIEFTVSSDLNVTYSNKKDQMLLNIQYAFNPLNQLVAFASSIRGADTEIIIGMLNVDPVDISININKEKQNIMKKKFLAPGPFILTSSTSADGTSQLAIEHKPTGKILPLDLTGTISSMLGLELRSQSDGNNLKCPVDQAGHLNLAAVHHDLENRFRSFLPDLGPEVLGIMKMIGSQG